MWLFYWTIKMIESISRINLCDIQFNFKWIHWRNVLQVHLCWVLFLKWMEMWNQTKRIQVQEMWNQRNEASEINALTADEANYLVRSFVTFCNLWPIIWWDLHRRNLLTPISGWDLMRPFHEISILCPIRYGISRSCKISCHFPRQNLKRDIPTRFASAFSVDVGRDFFCIVHLLQLLKVKRAKKLLFCRCYKYKSP